MPWGAAIAAIVGYAASSDAASSAASSAQAGQTIATQTQLLGLAQQQKQFSDLMKMAKPYRQAGKVGLEQYAQYAANPEAMYQSPTFQAMLEQGTKAVEGSAAARGTQLSGRTLADLQQMGMATASQYRSQIMGELANLANIGQSSINAGFGIGGQMMQQTGAAYGNLANLAQQTGQIQAGAAMGQGSAATQLAGTLGSAYIKSQAPATTTTTAPTTTTTGGPYLQDIYSLA